MYKIRIDILGTVIVFVDGDTQMWIPCDEMNVDYQAYLAWVAEGNTAEEWTGN